MMGVEVADYLTSAKPETTWALLPGEDEPGLVLGADEDQDRGAVLVNLASYSERQ